MKQTIIIDKLITLGYYIYILHNIIRSNIFGTTFRTLYYFICTNEKVNYLLLVTPIAKLSVRVMASRAVGIGFEPHSKV